MTLRDHATDVYERACEVQDAVNEYDRDRIMRALWRVEMSVASMRKTVLAREASPDEATA